MSSILEDEVVCPHCGYEFSDNYEKEDDGALDCPSCERPFWYARNVTVTYTMVPLEREECPRCGEHAVLDDYHGSIGSVDERLCESCLGVAIHKLKRSYIESLTD